ncbi:hypothetical protein [Actinomadura sp. 9N215]|uniref:hypothetical protein n=1 Tax=Actinomadura sp. 9N215 TaxID=3375150 RepID=UPI0037B92D4B
MTAPSEQPKTSGKTARTRTGRPLSAVSPEDAPERERTWLIERAGEHARIMSAVSPPDGSEGWVLLDSAHFLDKRKEEAFFVISRVETRTIQTRYVNAIICDMDKNPVLAPDGSAQRFIIKLGMERKDGSISPPVVVWEGLIEVLETFMSYDITSARTLRPPEWSWYARIRTVNKGGAVRAADIAVMDLRQMQSKASYIDRLGLSSSGCIGELVKYIRIKLNEMADSGLSVQGQGPVRTDDGERVFCAKSVVFDDAGNVRPEIRTDLSGLPEPYRYYDVTPPADLDDETVTAGCRELIASYDEIPVFPEIPAAFLGSLFTAPVATLEPQFFVAAFLSGEKGSGKTFFSLRYDAVQSRTLRGRINAIKPAMNLGDRTGSTKGAKYRAKMFGGFSITADDVIKKGDSQYQINEAREQVSNITRSFESGGGALGQVDRSRNKVVSGESGALQGNIRWTSEERIPGASTLERLIVLPHLTEEWGGGLFDTQLSERLSSPESIEAQHQAWSALAVWEFARLDSLLPELYARATDVTRTWNVSSRSRDRYAAVLAGHLIFAEFCAERGIDLSERIEAVTAALHDCALNQQNSSLSPADLFRLRLRQMLTDGRISIMGRPMVGPDGMEDEQFSDPRVLREVPQDDGTTEVVRELPKEVRSLSDLGVRLQNSSALPANKNQNVSGYLIPPRTGGGRAGKSPFRGKWTVIIPVKDQKFANLCHAMTEYSRNRDGETFRPQDVMRSLDTERKGCKSRIRVQYSPDAQVWKKVPASTVIEIDCSWLFDAIESEV